MENKSIYKQFYLKLIFATSLFIIILSFIFYEFTRKSFYDNIQNNLLYQAKKIEKSFIKDSFKPVKTQFQNIELIEKDGKQEIEFKSFEKNNEFYLQLIYPLTDKYFLQISRDISLEREILYSIIFRNLFILAIPGFILMLLYSLIVSKSLLKPIMQINKKLSNMDESSLSFIDTKDLPNEFLSLANSINSLTNRIATYVKFKKELFIGIAHELKTPLAVMKLKNELLLKKTRSTNEYEDALKLTVKQIDDMNIMISSILDIGRTEGAQFESPKKLDLIKYLKRKTNDFKLLSKQKDIDIIFTSNIASLEITIRETLLNQILQNFVQNAIKFSENGKKIYIKLRKSDDKLILKVIDEGNGIDENIDLFAPFKKIGSKNGVGLGLYLAKIASDSLNGKISIKNRKDKIIGCVAKLEFRYSV